MKIDASPKAIMAVALIVMLGLLFGAVGYLVFNKPKINPQVAITPPPAEEKIIIATDKTEYEQGENISISLKNNSNNQVKYFENIGCGAEIFADNEWNLVYDKSSCEWGQELSLPAREIKKVDSVFPFEAGRYRLTLFYKSEKNKSEKILKLKEIGNIVCSNIPADLENLLINGKWVKNEVKPKDMCMACGCSATDKNVFSVDGASIDITSVSCYGTGYTINYKGEKFNCVSENYKNYIEQSYLYPSENWEKVYSNEFTIKEKTSEVLTPDYVISHSNELNGKVIIVEGMAVAGYPGICTEIECRPENPCCNDCSGDLNLKGEKKEITLISSSGDSYYCSGNDCGLNKCYPLELGKYYTVKGKWTIGEFNNRLVVKEYKEKTAVDPRCGQKAKVSKICSAVGYEFDLNEEKCVVVNGAGCIDNLPFSTLEECQKVCETNNEK